MQHQAQEQKLRSDRIRFCTLLGAMLALAVVAFLYLRRHNSLTRRLRDTNKSMRQQLDKLRVANRHAQESDRDKTAFIQNMSHEIRTPLNAIVGFSQVLTDSGDALDAVERKNIVRIINNNSDVLNTLINGILDLTSIESGKYVIKHDEVRVNDMCHKVLANTRRCKAEGVHLLLDTELSDDFTVVTDAYRVEQVLTNLLTNAEKNTEHGSITLACSLDERPGMLTFTVTDTGIGVPRDKQKAIFERFCKLNFFKQGVGLGLNVCRVIAKRLNGMVDIDADYSDGARFWFAIPLK